MKKIMLLVFVLMAFTSTINAKDLYLNQPTTLIGRLGEVVLQGGETTGWFLSVDTAIVISTPPELTPTFFFGIVGQDKNTITVDMIEIDYCCCEKLESLGGALVKVTGFLKWKRGKVRGIYYYILAGSVEEVKP